MHEIQTGISYGHVWGNLKFRDVEIEEKVFLDLQDSE
jgi:hypothetical protein